MVGAWAGNHGSDPARAFGSGGGVLPSQPAATSSEAVVVAPRTTIASSTPASITSAAKINVPISSPELRERLKPLLNAGANMDTVSAGFRNAEDFAAAVHASKNTKLPFTALKHAVIDEGKTLAAAIRALKPAADASLEADLARSEARSDLTSLK